MFTEIEVLLFYVTCFYSSKLPIPVINTTSLLISYFQLTVLMGKWSHVGGSYICLGYCYGFTLDHKRYDLEIFRKKYCLDNMKSYSTYRKSDCLWSYSSESHDYLRMIFKNIAIYQELWFFTFTIKFISMCDISYSKTLSHNKKQLFLVKISVLMCYAWIQVYPHEHKDIFL